jgi:O-antigen ligase
VSAIALVTLVALNVDGKGQFLAGRLDAPLGYRNATACLFAFVFWPLIVFAAARGGARLARAAAFALATLGLGLAFLTESRGVLLGLVLGAVVLVGIGPERVRRMWLALFAAGGVALFSGVLLKPYDAFDGGRGIVTAGNVQTAAHGLTLLTAVAFVVGVLIAILDNGLRPEGMLWARRLGRTALAMATVAAVAAVLVSVGNPISYAGDKLDEFRDVNASSTGTTRLSATGGQRYDLWRVAWTGFESRPVAGVGAGGYELRYYRLRRTDRNVTDPHSLVLDVLSGTGVAGFALLAAFVAAIAATLWAGRDGPLPNRRAAAALVAAGVVVIGQAQVDFFWMIPGLAGLGLLCVVLGAALLAPAPRAPDPNGRRAPYLVAGAVLAAASLGVLSLFLSDYEVRRARTERSTGASLEAARRAERLDPWALAPRYLQASALETTGRRGAARAELQGALRAEPRNFVTIGLLGDLEVRAGNLAAARRYYARALQLNPRDVGLRKLAAIRAAGP